MRFLTPGEVQCSNFDKCSKRSYAKCSVCGANAIATEKIEKERKKKNYFKRLK